MPHPRPFAVLFLSLALAGAAAGCGSDSDSKTTSTATAAAKPVYCDDVTKVHAAIESFEDVSIDAGVIDEVQAKFAELRTAVDALRTSVGDAFVPQVDAVTAALRATGDTIASMRDSSRIPAALVALPGDIDAVTTSITALLTEAGRNCD